MSLKKGPERGPNGILLSNQFILDSDRIKIAKYLDIEGIDVDVNIMQYNYNKKWWQLNATPLSDYEEFVLINHDPEEGYSLHWREKERAKEIIGDDSSSPNWDHEVLLHFVKEPHHDDLKWIFYQGDAYWILSRDEIASIFL